jgi:hypothetical protein
MKPATRPSLVVLLALFAVLACLLATPSQGAITRWSKTLTAVPGKAKTWRSPVKFGPHRTVYVGLYVGRFSLPIRERSDCILFADGAGVHARVNICGDKPAPMRLRYRATASRPVTFRLVYEF